MEEERGEGEGEEEVGEEEEEGRWSWRGGEEGWTAITPMQLIDCCKFFLDADSAGQW